MILAADLQDTLGRLLFKAGSVVEEKHIRIMKMWGVNGADIVGVEQSQLAKEELSHINSTLLDTLRHHIDNLFLEPGGDVEHPVMVELRQICMVRLAQGVSSGTLDIAKLEKSDYFPEPGDLGSCEPLPTLPQLVEKRLQLASLPDIYYRVMEIVNDSKSSASHLARVVGQDPGLSASLLKIVNSAFYGLPVKVSSITRAIALIGGRELSTIAMGISVIRFFRDIPPHVVDMKRFWLHSIAVGSLARFFASQKAGLQDEDFFIAGLLHDIGRLIMYREFPTVMTEAIRRARSRRIPLIQVEQEFFKYDHTQVADAIMEKWGFPKILRQCIRHHHSPQRSPVVMEASVVYLANLLSDAIEYGYSGNDYIPHLVPGVWETLEFSTSLLATAIKHADRQVREVLHAFSLD